ncbi:unnamed protein product [Rhizoctonia solani]|nr:unnamed protein product [Rhizoctonia solani]
MSSPPRDRNDATFELEPPLSFRSDILSDISAPSVSKGVLPAGSHVSESLQQEVIQQAPGGKRCLVTCDVEQLHCCHVIEQSIDPIKLQKLATAWGCMTEGIDVNNYSNLLWRTFF